MDQQSETELREAEQPEAELRARDEKAPEEADVADAPAEDRAEQDDEGEPQDEASSPKKKHSLLLVGLLIAALVAGGAAYLYFSTLNIQSTDDAYTDGRAVTIAPQVSGTVVSLDVTDNQFVRKGEPLIHIDPRQYVQDRDLRGRRASGRQGAARRPEARRRNRAQEFSGAAGAGQGAARLGAGRRSQGRGRLPAPAQPAQTGDDAAGDRRRDGRFAAGPGAGGARPGADAVAEPVPQRIGQADADVGQLTGQVEQAQAKLDQANLNLEWTVVRAPQDGWITKRNVEVGNYVTPGQQIFSIVSPEVWVTANFKETQLDRIRPGQPVDIEIDAYPHLKLKGHVDSIQLGSGSKFTAFPPENATGNFIKIVQRLPVKIAIDSGLDPDLPLPLGISAVPTVRLK